MLLASRQQKSMFGNFFIQIYQLLRVTDLLQQFQIQVSSIMTFHTNYLVMLLNLKFFYLKFYILIQFIRVQRLLLIQNSIFALVLHMGHQHDFQTKHVYSQQMHISLIIKYKMNQKNLKLAQSIIKKSYINLGENSLLRRQQIVKQIITQRQLPQEGLDDLTIRYILDQLALMDSNNFHGKIGVGERQSRIFSQLVKQRHYYMGHGIGRSGDIMANQPKAAGSSLLLQLARLLTVSAFKQLNYDFVKQVLLIPSATGMSLALSFLTLAENFPNKKYVIVSRIDQKTCLKSIITANLIPIVIQLDQKEDCLASNAQAIQKKINQIGPQNILSIVSTTSCFAPRIPDDVEQNSFLAKKYGLYHVVNNAYGLWCSKIAHKIKQGTRKGQCTIVIQSTDKNFMVPVGGSIIFTQKPQILQKISNKYPGRASASPIVDMFITLLSMGKQTIRSLYKQRKQSYQYFKQQSHKIAQKLGAKVLNTPQNTISMAMSIKNLQFKKPTQLGSILYTNRVMGHRIVDKSQVQTKVAGLNFKNYGSHHNSFSQMPYITFAAAIGTKKEQVDLFLQRLVKGIKQLTKKQQKSDKLKQQKKESTLNSDKEVFKEGQCEVLKKQQKDKQKDETYDI